jgi:hypothetical protein
LLDLFCGAGGAAMGYREADLIWAAGFFDGEGSVNVTRDKRPGRRLALHLDIEQVDERPLRRFAEAVGWKGNIVVRAPRAPNRRTIHRIAMSGPEVIRVMQMLWPWISEPKREQWLRCVEQWDAEP